jgi:hypothetical protein
MSMRTMRILRAAFLVWAAVWIALAIVTAHELLVLRDLSDTIVKTGKAVDTAGQALQSVAGIPFVGGRVGPLADQVRTAGQSAVASGHTTRASSTNLAILLGIAVGLIPTVPALGLYLPLRSAWRRERAAVRHALQERGDDPLLGEYLARRALQNLPYHSLRSITDRPWADVEAGRVDALAAAELERLGLRR